MYSTRHTDFSPFGMLQPQRGFDTSNYRFAFGGHEKDDEVYGANNWYTFGDYGYDPRIVQRPRTEPLASKYPHLSPYVAFGNNPIVYSDPDGRDVKAANEAAKSAITNTLTKEDAAFVKFNSEGVIDIVHMSQHNSNSGNFNALKQLAVTDSRMYEVKVDDKYTYKNEKGELIEHKMIEIEKGGILTVDNPTGEYGERGITQTPGDAPMKRNSPDNTIRITINSGLSEEGQAENFAHEGYGHATLYSEGKPHAHGNGAGMTDTNAELQKRIKTRVTETKENYQKTHTKTKE